LWRSGRRSRKCAAERRVFGQAGSKSLGAQIMRGAISKKRRFHSLAGRREAGRSGYGCNGPTTATVAVAFSDPQLWKNGRLKGPVQGVRSKPQVAIGPITNVNGTWGFCWVAASIAGKCRKRPRQPERSLSIQGRVDVRLSCQTFSETPYSGSRPSTPVPPSSDPEAPPNKDRIHPGGE